MSPGTITGNTKVPMSILWGAILLTFGVVGSAVGASYYIGAKIASIDNRLESLEKSRDDDRVDNLTKSMASELAFRTAMANPGIRISDPRDPNGYIGFSTVMTSPPNTNKRNEP